MSNILREEEALAAAHALCPRMNAIWRVPTGRDFGIDAEIEFLELNDLSTSTGLKVAVQAKGGKSYFREIKEEPHCYVFYPTSSQVRYWQNHVLPVILIVFNPTTNELLFTEIKPQLSMPSAKGANRILIPKSSVFRPESGTRLRKLAELHRLETDSGQTLLTRLKGLEVEFDGLSVSGVDFLVASLMPGLDALEIHKARIVKLITMMRDESTMNSPKGSLLRLLEVSASQISHARITDPFWDQFCQSVYDRGMFPEITVALNQYGHQTVKALCSDLAAYLNPQKYSTNTHTLPELLNEIVEQCHAEADYRDNKDTMMDASLDSFSL